MEVGPEKVPLSEFETTFSKNNDDKVITKKYLDEYAALYVDFKRKVLYAKEQQMDTSQAFIRELAGYRRQLARPYLTDKNAENALVDEAYQRMRTEVRASHILLSLDENATPADTLVVYNKLMDLRSQILSGSSFASVAKANSQDPSAKTNGGDLGYFSAFRMVYSFESVAYNTPKGDVSLPFRTQFGYHILKVDDIRENRGEVKVAHIMIEEREDTPPKEVAANLEKIAQLKEAFAEGKTFEELVKFSADKSSAKNNGVLPMFGSGQMVSSFEDAAFFLQNVGDITLNPVKTIYGWHFIKLLEKKPVPSFEDAKTDIERKIKRDSRSNQGKDALVKTIKKEYKFKEKFSLSNLDPFYKLDLQNWDRSSYTTQGKTMFQLDNINYTQDDFADYINNSKTKTDPKTMVSTINKMYKDWIEKTCLDYEDSQLENKYPEFKALMKEYHDGIMLFDLMDKKVWSKAISDSVGLKKYYELTKENYVWDETVSTSTFTCLNQDVENRLRSLINGRNSLKNLSKQEVDLLNLGKGEQVYLTDNDIVRILNLSNANNVSLENKDYKKGESEVVDQKWSLGLTKGDDQLDGSIKLIHINEIKSGKIKTFEEARGSVISDYQDYLESSWKKELEEKYPAIIYKDVLYSLTK
jgi:peptidyl-prolyl cis-trans isomerase SurA